MNEKQKTLNFEKIWLFWEQDNRPDVYEDYSGMFADWLDKCGKERLEEISKNLQIECLIHPNGSRYHEKCPSPNFKRCYLCEHAHYFLKTEKEEKK